MLDVLIWNKYSRVIMLLSKELDITPRQALDIFYESPAYDWMVPGPFPLITMGDGFICDEVKLQMNRERPITTATTTQPT